jgi:uncharacterized membrane protein YbhN (UPF0104 family)
VPAAKNSEELIKLVRWRPLILRAVVILAVLLSVARAVHAIWRDRAGFADALDHLGALPLTASLLFAVLATFANWPIWRGVLRAMHAEIPVGASARLFFVSQLGKYLPGAVWPIVAQTEVGRRYGLARVTMVTANVVAVFLSCAVGLTLAAICLPLASDGLLSTYWWLLLLAPPLAAAVHPRLAPRLVNSLLSAVHRPAIDFPSSSVALLAPVAWSVSVWVALGAHVAVLALALGGGGVSTVLLGVGASALAVIAGVLAVPLPAGIGVRDVILTAVLSTQLTSTEAILVVLTSRLMLIVADLGLALGSLATTRMRVADLGGKAGTPSSD